MKEYQRFRQETRSTHLGYIVGDLQSVLKDMEWLAAFERDNPAFAEECHKCAASLKRQIARIEKLKAKANGGKAA